ncbi:MAG: hypothetical protein R3C05_04595 [Pirellulaceae bacterium]
MILAIVLFILVGMGLGHLIWYRDRGEEEARFMHLESRYRKLRVITRKRKRQHQQQIKEWKTARTQWEGIRDQNRELTSSLRSMEESARDAESAHLLLVEQKNAAQHDAEAAVAKQDQLRRELAELQSEKDRLHAEAAVKHKAEIDMLHEQLSALQEQSETQNEASSETIERLTQQCATLQELVDAGTIATADLAGELARREESLESIRLEMDAVRNERDVLIQEADKRETALKTVHHDLTVLQDQRNALTQDVEHHGEALNAVQLELNAVQDERDALLQSSEQLTETLEAVQLELKSLRSQRKVLTQESAARDKVLQSAQTEISELQREREELKQAVTDESEEDLQSVQTAFSELQREHDELKQAAAKREEACNWFKPNSASCSVNATS